MVDWLAKREREKSFYHCRQQVPMHTFRHFLPHFWTLFSTQEGRPRCCAMGLHAIPPDLPATSSTSGTLLRQSTAQDEHLVFQCAFSLGTANVASMFTGEKGHAGKTDYLRHQFRSMRLNMLGLQETRTPRCCSAQDHVLRLGPGCRDGQGGIEL